MRLYMLSTAATALLYGVPAILLLMGDAHFMNELEALGYPAYFAVMLGVSKLAAIAVILSPGALRLKEWAYAGLVLDAAAAVASRLLAHGDPVLVVPSIVVGALAILSWATRPDSRRLSANGYA